MTASENAKNGTTPDPERTAEEPAAGPESQREEAEARAERHRADFLRAIAELENYRKRAAREVESARQYGIERFAAELLPVADSLAMALAAESADAETLRAGQQATQRLLAKAFERVGITEIDPAGASFDPAQHEAMATQPSAEHAPDTVLQVIQRGYLLNGRLLRPARVIVSAEAADPGGGRAPGG